MLRRRWWDAAVAAGSVVIAATLVFAFPPGSAVRLGVGLACTAALVVVYAVIARPVIADPDPKLSAGWRYPAFLVSASVLVATATGAAGFLAMLQTLAYPMIFTLAGSRRRAALGCVIFASTVMAGIVVGGGFAPTALVAGLLTAGFSLAFALAFGLWFVSVAEYAEERDRLVTQLTAAQAEVAALSRDRGAAQERERLAREIHDTLAQTLAGLVILAERAGRQSRAGETDAAATTIATVEQVARDALGEARALVARTAAVPSEPAFESAVERLVERFRGQSAAAISLDVSGGARPIDRDAQVVLLRCLQEALANVTKHSGADRVVVRVVVGDDASALLEVVDDGRGFDPEAPRAGFGIDGMRERVALAGGELELSSAPDRGTSLSVRLPSVESRMTVGETP